LLSLIITQAGILNFSEIENKLFENQSLLKQPVVRNGKTMATVGLEPKVWESWK
jgi:arsenate reductase-like glutaredoxin family protein